MSRGASPLRFLGLVIGGWVCVRLFVTAPAWLTETAEAEQAGMAAPAKPAAVRLRGEPQAASPTHLEIAPFSVPKKFIAASLAPRSDPVSGFQGNSRKMSAALISAPVAVTTATDKALTLSPQAATASDANCSAAVVSGRSFTNDGRAGADLPTTSLALPGVSAGQACLHDSVTGNALRRSGTLCAQ